ncbi:hypothetical protein P3342_007157 [Pyrenophora teres f. teres]|nr:hypothetical protein P3342_007157 [Pyrenophora teres f. teres]
MLPVYEQAILQRARELYELWRRLPLAIRSVERGARNGFARDVSLGAASAPSNSSLDLLFFLQTRRAVSKAWLVQQRRRSCCEYTTSAAAALKHEAECIRKSREDMCCYFWTMGTQAQTWHPSF